jgi:hypothetical protein
MNKFSYYFHRIFAKPIQTVNDDYLSWLSFANAGMLTPGNTFAFNHAIKNLPSDDPIIEIGSFCGLTTNAISYLLKKHKRHNKIINSDKWIFEGSEKKYLGSSEILHEEYRIFVKESFKRNVSFFSKDNLPYAIEVFSDDFFELWNKGNEVEDVFGRKIRLGGSISFSYIDGNHNYEFAKRDFVNTDRYLVRNGFVLFDDTSFESTFGCKEFMKELEKNPQYELVMKNPNYLFKKK